MASHVRRRRTRREVALFAVVLAVLAGVVAAIVLRSGDSGSLPAPVTTPDGLPADVTTSVVVQRVSQLRPAPAGATPDALVVLAGAVTDPAAAPPGPSGSAPHGSVPDSSAPQGTTAPPPTAPQGAPIDGTVPESVTPPVDVAGTGDVPAEVTDELGAQVYSATSGWLSSNFYLPAEAGLPGLAEVTDAPASPASVTDLARHADATAEPSEVTVTSMKLFTPTTGGVPAPIALLADGAVVEVLVPWAAIVAFDTPSGERTVSVAAVLHATVGDAGELTVGASTLDDPAWGALNVS